MKTNLYSQETVKKILTEADADEIRGRSLLDHASELEKEAAELCLHSADHIRMAYGNSSPPWTICLVCGYAEEGWGIGGWKLPHGYIDHMPIVTMDRDRLMAKRRFFMTQVDITHDKICVLHHGKPKDSAQCDGVCQR